MRNLKKILSLALALVMVFSLVTFANAAGTTDFNDDAEIDHPTAVNTLVSLNVIDGVGNNNFNPAGSVKRGELCKIIAVILNGGQEPVLDEGSSSFSDTTNHWARAYVEYCVAQGIVDGYGDGTFKPEQPVTGSEAAKMLLVAMGYNPEVFGLTGARWAVNVAVNANKAQLYKDILGTNPANPLNRDATAQMTFNAIFAGTMGIEYGYDPATGKITNNYVLKPDETLFSTKFKGDNTKTGILTGISYNDVKDEYTYTVGGTSYTMKQDFSELYGMNVRILENTSNKVDKQHYGMFINEGSLMAENYASEVDVKKLASDKQVKVGGTTYKTDGTALDVYFYNAGEQTISDLKGWLDANTLSWVRLIDTDGDNEANEMVITPQTFNKITYVGKDNVTFKTGGNKKIADITLYDGAAKDDYVVETAAAYTVYNKAEYTKAEPETAEITSYRTSGNPYRVNGSWKKLDSAISGKLSGNTNVGNEIKYYSFGSVIYELEIISGRGLEDIALVVDYTSTTTDGGSVASHEVELLLADGTKVTGKSVNTDGDPVDPSSFNQKMVSFEVNNSGNYILKLVDESNKSGFENADNDTANDSKLTLVDRNEGSSSTIKSVKDQNGSNQATYEIADDAVVFWYHSDKSDAKIYTGKELKSLGIGASSGQIAATSVQAYATSKASGFETVTALVIVANKPGNFTVGNNYGYLTAHAYTGTENGKKYVYYTIWTADGEVQAKEEGTVLTDKKSGSVVCYDSIDAAGIVRNLRVLAQTADYNVGIVTGWDGSKIAFVTGSGATDNSKVVNDTQVLYVNSADKKGVEGGSIVEGQDKDSNGDGDGVLDEKDPPNAIYIKSATADELVLVIMDVENEMNIVSPAADLTGITTPTAQQVNDALANGSAKLDASKIPAGTVIPEGSTLDLSGSSTITAGHLANISGTGTVDIGNKPVTGYADPNAVATGLATQHPASDSAQQEVTMNSPALKGSGTVSGFGTSPDYEANVTGSSTVQYLTLGWTATQAADKDKAAVERYWINDQGKEVHEPATNSAFTVTDGVAGGVLFAVGDTVTKYVFDLYKNGDDSVPHVTFTVNIKH